MGIRNVWLYGMAYSVTGNVNIEVSTEKDGIIYNGPVQQTEAMLMPGKVTDYKQLANWQISDETPIDNTSVGVLTIKPTNGDITIVTSGSDKFDVTNFSKVVKFSNKLVKTEAVLNGQPYDPGPGYDPNNFSGAWQFIIRDGETMILNMHLDRLRYPVPGYQYPTDPNHFDYQIPEGHRGLNAPVYDVNTAGKIIPSYVPVYLQPGDTDYGSKIIPINVPAPIVPPVV